MDGTATTNLYAVDLIRFLPEFDAKVTSGTFSAKADQCYLLPSRKETRTTISRLVPPSNDLQKITTAVQENKINIYPSVTTESVYITGPPQDLENVEITVFDQLGRKMLQIPKTTYSNKAVINLGRLSNGVYILQLKQLAKTLTRKIIVQK